MDLESFTPPTNLLLLAISFNVLRFENQRWIRAIRGGMRGGWAWVSDMVVIIGGLAMLLALAVLAIVFIYSGWKVAMGLMASVFVVGLAASIMIGLIFGPDNGFIYIVATIGLIPAGYLLVREVIQLYSLLG